MKEIHTKSAGLKIDWDENTSGCDKNVAQLDQ